MKITKITKCTRVPVLKTVNIIVSFKLTLTGCAKTRVLRNTIRISVHMMIN